MKKEERERERERELRYLIDQPAINIDSCEESEDPDREKEKRKLFLGI